MDYKFDLNHKASNFRIIHGIGTSDPFPFKAILNKLNILCVFKPLSENTSGMVGQLNDLNFMLINANHAIGRQNFTIAHELYHIYYDKTFKNSIIDYTNNTNGEEKKANTFASYLLLPDGLIDLIPENETAKNKITIQTMFKIEQFYQTSRSALLVRLKGLNFISEEYITNNKNNIIQQAKMLGYDTKLYEKGNNNVVIGDYALKAKALYDKDIISESNYIDYLLDLGIKSEDISLNVFTK